MPSRLLTALLAAVLSLAVLVGVAPAAGAAGDRAAAPTAAAEAPGAVPQAAAEVHAAVVSARAQVAALRAEVEQTSAELTDGTRRLEQGRDHLADLQDQARAARAAADAALAQVAAARARLAALVGAAYRQQPRPSDMSLALATAPGELSAAVLASAELDHVQGNQTALVVDAKAQDARARVLVAQAEQLEEQARAQTADLEAQVEALTAAAEQTQTRLEAAASRLAEAEAAKEAARIAALTAKARKKALKAARARLLADVSGGGAFCTAASTAGYPNGFLPPEVLCPLSVGGGHRLRADAAKALNRLMRDHELCVTDSYRSYGAQVDVFARKPDLAAVPGTSNHGLGVAVDLCGGVERFGTQAHRWMKAHAAEYGWVHPAWAEPGGSRPEPWHWEYVGVAAAGKKAED